MHYHFKNIVPLSDKLIVCEKNIVIKLYSSILFVNVKFQNDFKKSQNIMF